MATEEFTIPRPTTRVSLSAIARAVRTRQWAKNALLFAGFLFAGHLRQPLPVLWEETLRVLLAFACFCALSGATYLINDWHDIEGDRLHPLKKHRPLASGRMSLRLALMLIVFLLFLATVAALTVWQLDPGTGPFPTTAFPLAAATYFVLTLTYSFVLKHEVIIDVLWIAVGFVLRVVAGCLAAQVRISPWIIFCTFTLALFIALCKRRAELLEMGENSAHTRRVLPLYSVEMLDTFIAVAAGLTITAYSLYTFLAQQSSTALSPSVRQSQWPLLMTTIPFVVYGVFRYLFLAHSSAVGGEPEQMLKDKRMILNVVLWALLIAALTLRR
ncbi:MAG: UbiA prenyltransferase family protein [Armatimonadota bacterium]|nr:UbiA prenyltransferase family protein [Armatimonadota bacterium]